MISFFAINSIVISLFVAIDGQEFCNSYADNGYKVLVHSPDNRVLTLVVGNDYWFVDLINEKLLIRGDGNASGVMEGFGTEMSALFTVNQRPDQTDKSSTVAYYDVRHK